MNFADVLNKLNIKQKLAVETIDGPVMVVAGPGTGKTQILALRVVNILNKTDTLAREILCLTFTESAAFNLRQRLISFLGSESYKVKVFTFHGFATDLINSYPEEFFDSSDFRPLEELTQFSVLEKILDDLDYDNPLSSYHPEFGWSYLKDIISKIKEIKQGGLSPEEFFTVIKVNQEFLIKVQEILGTFFEHRISLKLAPELNLIINKIKQIEILELPKHLEIENYKFKLLKNLQKIQSDLEEGLTESLKEYKDKNFKTNGDKQKIFKDLLECSKLLALAEIYKKYQQELYNRRYYDFEDMIIQVNKALESNLDFRSEIQEKFLYILVDEFQDTNGSQMRLIENLLNLEVTNYRPNLFVVGDDDQSIFKFQGANLDNLLSFRSQFANVQQIFLTINYRSNQEILDFSMQVIEQSLERLSVALEVDKKLTAGYRGE